MPDVTLTIDLTGEEDRKVREALRRGKPDASFLEEDAEEGRDEPLLRFEEGVQEAHAYFRAGQITRAAAEIAGVSDTSIRAGMGTF